MRFDPSGFQLYKEYYLYSDKSWEMAPAGVSYYDLAGSPKQNAPIVVTASGLETTTPTEPWAQVSGSGKYEKIGFGYFDLTPSGDYNPASYEFALHPGASGKIIFNGVLTENVYIEYENGPSGYFIMDTIDYNPVRNEVEGGFVHFSQTTDPTNIFVNVAQESVRGDGFHGVKISASVYDSDYDRVPERDVIIEIESLSEATDTVGNYAREGFLQPNVGTVYSVDASGSVYAVKERTNRRGEVFANYLTFPSKTGIVKIKGYVLAASGIYDDASFMQYYMSVGPFILDISLLDTLDYLS